MSADNTNRWILYIVECNDRTLYTGVTTDIQRRISEHNYSKRGAKYTKTRRPVRLVYTEKHDTRSLAQKRECELKKMSRKKKLELIDEVS